MVLVFIRIMNGRHSVLTIVRQRRKQPFHVKYISNVIIHILEEKIKIAENNSMGFQQTLVYLFLIYSYDITIDYFDRIATNRNGRYPSQLVVRANCALLSSRQEIAVLSIDHTMMDHPKVSIKSFNSSTDGRSTALLCHCTGPILIHSPVSGLSNSLIVSKYSQTSVAVSMKKHVT